MFSLLKQVLKLDIAISEGCWLDIVPVVGMIAVISGEGGFV